MAFIDMQSRVNTIALRRLGEDLVLDGIPLRGDFAEPYAQAYMGGVDAEARAPQAVLASTDVPAGVHGKPLVARGKAYVVVSHKPDGFGLSTLVLEVA